MDHHTTLDKLTTDNKCMTNNDWHSIIQRNTHCVDSSVKYTNDSKLSVKKEPLDDQTSNKNSDKNQSHDKSVFPPKGFLAIMVESINIKQRAKLMDNKVINHKCDTIAMDIYNILPGKGRMMDSSPLVGYSKQDCACKYRN